MKNRTRFEEGFLAIFAFSTVVRFEIFLLKAKGLSKDFGAPQAPAMHRRNGRRLRRQRSGIPQKPISDAPSTHSVAQAQERPSAVVAQLAKKSPSRA